MPLDPADLVAIHQLYSRYNVAVDKGDGQAFAACFTTDGLFDAGGMTFEGGEAIAEFAVGVPLMIPGSRHIASNVVVDGDGETATGTAYLTLLDTRTAPVSITMSGSYEDHLVKGSGSWRFSDRRFTPDTPAS
jgi:uncharacterized protein (TIGR02246 family)